MHLDIFKKIKNKKLSTKPFLVFTEDVPKMQKKNAKKKKDSRENIWLIWLKYLLRAENSNLKTTLTQIIITVIFKKVTPNVSCVADN